MPKLQSQSRMKGLTSRSVNPLAAQPLNVQRITAAHGARELDEFRAEVLVDQELHPVDLRRGTRQSATMTAHLGSLSLLRGRPRARVASA